MTCISSSELSSKAERLLARLVQCPSVTPPDGQPIEAPYGEGALVQLLAEHLTQIGADVSVQEIVPGRPNLIACIEGRDPSRTILLDAHTDTVSHLGMTIDPFAAEVRDGRLYGRGACDTKGPMTSMLLALESLADEHGLACNVIFAATCDEEAGGNGARQLVADGINADFAIVAEPTDLTLVTKHKGVLRARIDISGKAAHSSTPLLGRNAIYPMARIISNLEEMAAELEGLAPDADLGTPTLAVTTITGGFADNIVPPNCGIVIDRRTLPSESIESVKASIVSRVKPSVESIPWVDPQIDWVQAYPSMETPVTHACVKQLQEILISNQNSAECGSAAYATNGGFYADAGIPAVVFGPGSIANAHTKDESIEIEQVVTAANVLKTFLKTI
jgi:acetylornithine deacetylase/succinyl-diaminopimelate desuccinylase family protein